MIFPSIYESLWCVRRARAKALILITKKKIQLFSLEIYDFDERLKKIVELLIVQLEITL